MNIQTKAISKALMSIQAISLSPATPYKWASGLHSPIYCDNRLIMSYPDVRNLVEDALADIISINYPKAEVVAGTATAGIPHAAYVSERLNLPMIYVRSSHKDHGKQNVIEGYLKEGQKVVMIEDLISTGGSVIGAAKEVELAGGDVIGITSVFNYSFVKASEAFAEQHYDVKSLLTYPELIDYAVEQDEFLVYKDTLTKWYKDPELWSNQQEENV